MSLLKNLQGLILFASGVIISAVVSGLLENSINLSEAALVAITILVVVASIYFFADISRRIQVLSDRMQATVYYVHERYQVSNIFKGIIFNELKKLVDGAESEILVLSVVSKEWKAQATDIHPSRQSYLRALEQLVNKHLDSGEFTYKRVIQVPTDIEGSLVPYIGDTTAAHCRNMIEVDQSKGDSSKLNISIKKGITQRLTGFMIFDRRYVTVAVDGLTPDGHSYQAGLFVLEDREGKQVDRFLRLFTELENNAQPITLAELEP
jgi:hypothetical protein